MVSKGIVRVKEKGLYENGSMANMIKSFSIFSIDWPQLPPLPTNDDSEDSDDSEPDDSMEDSRPRYNLILSIVIK